MQEIHNGRIVDHVFLCSVQATVSMDGGKLSVQFPNYHHTSEISGGKLIEVRFAMSIFSEEKMIHNDCEIYMIIINILFIFLYVDLNHRLYRPQENQQEDLIHVTVSLLSCVPLVTSNLYYELKCKITSFSYAYFEFFMSECVAGRQHLKPLYKKQINQMGNIPVCRHLPKSEITLNQRSKSA